MRTPGASRAQNGVTLPVGEKPANEATMILLRNLLYRLYERTTRRLSPLEAKRRIVQIEAYRGQRLQRRFERRLAERGRAVAES